jgi:hypothetical protein
VQRRSDCPTGGAQWYSPWRRTTAALELLAPLAFARYLIGFFIGVAATVACQSQLDATREEMIAAAAASLDLVRQSVAKLAVEITKLQAAEQNILDKISMPSPRPTATPVCRLVSLTPSAR